MTVGQQLAGALGCASWRARYTLSEYAALAPIGGVIGRKKGGKGWQPAVGQPTPRGMNEVGVTDAVMATLWRYGPLDAAYAVSAPAESFHIGADIAVVDWENQQCVHYQAKVAKFTHTRSGDPIFTLKSGVTDKQVSRLGMQLLTLRNTTLKVTGRLALYQIETRQFLRKHRPTCPLGLNTGQTDLCYPWWQASWPITADPTMGQRYYSEVLQACGCSPGAILAAPVSGNVQTVHRVRPNTTWPWEYDLYEWFHTRSPLDSLPAGRRPGALKAERQLEPPRFAEYVEEEEKASDHENVEAIAREFAETMGLPDSQRLFMIMVGTAPKGR